MIASQSDVPLHRPADLSGLRVLVFGVGSFGGGIGAARFFTAAGARVIVTDRRPAHELTRAREALAGQPIERWVLGEHREQDFRDADWVVVNPAVPPSNPLLDLARNAGRVIVTEMDLFLRWCPTGQVAGITGSNGKSTTTQLVHDMVRYSGLPVHLGGNIGRSLLPDLEAIDGDDRVVLELSSFQLERLRADTPRPAVVAITQYAPNHIDWHGSESAYLRAKESVLAGTGAAVLPSASRHFARWCEQTSREVVSFGVDGQQSEYRFDGDLLRLGDTLRAGVNAILKGRANHDNIACAAAIATRLGATPDGIVEALENYRALPHRQEPVAEENCVTFINDSKATTPEATSTAIEAYAPNCVVLLGGSSKGVDWDDLARHAAGNTRHIVTYGSTAAAIADAMASHGVSCTQVGTLDEAVHAAKKHAQPGDTVLLSPACASYDQFQSYEERGKRFRELVDPGRASLR